MTRHDCASRAPGTGIGIQKNPRASKSSGSPEILPIRGGLIQVRGLRERGIYETPGGTRLVASSRRESVFQSSKVIARTGGGGQYYLYSTYSWAFHGPAEYKVNEAGEITDAENSVSLRVDELVDTGWTAGAH